jgi:phosphate transport system substrate-binding protein
MQNSFLMNRKFLWLLSLLLVAACNKNKGGETADTATSGSFELVADETLRPAIDSLVIGFNLQTPNAKVTVTYKNATEALDDLLQHRTRLVLIARPLGEKEHNFLTQQKIELIEADVAENAIGCIVNAKNPLKDISIDSLKALIQDKDKNTIRVSSSYLSSTEFLLDSIFLLDKYQEGRILRFQTSDSIISRVRNDEHAIGFVNAAWLKKLLNSGDSSVRVLRISQGSGRSIMMHLAYVLQGLYPLTSRICGYTTEVPNTLPRGFLAFAMSADGQRIFLNYDLLPKTQILKLVPPQ